MDVKEIRKLNLETLRDEMGSLNILAEHIGSNPSYLSQILGKGSTRNVGDTLARNIEVAFNKPRGWMDAYHSVNEEDAVYGGIDLELMGLIIELVQDKRLNLNGKDTSELCLSIYKYLKTDEPKENPKAEIIKLADFFGKTA